MLFATDHAHYLFAGDASYTQAQVLHDELAGVTASRAQALLNYQKIRTYDAHHPLVYLPSHDAATADRLCRTAVFSQLP